MKPDTAISTPAGRSGHGVDSVLQHLRAQSRLKPDGRIAVATSDAADEALSQVIPALLATVRAELGMDVAFVSQFIDGKRVFRYVDVPAGQPVIEAGGADPLEASWCKRVVDGRLPQFIEDAALLPAGAVDPIPFRIGTHLSVPVVLPSGEVCGTVCCFSFDKSARACQADLEMLRGVAAFLAACEFRHLARAGTCSGLTSDLREESKEIF